MWAAFAAAFAGAALVGTWHVLYLISGQDGPAPLVPLSRNAEKTREMRELGCVPISQNRAASLLTQSFPLKNLCCTTAGAWLAAAAPTRSGALASLAFTGSLVVQFTVSGSYHTITWPPKQRRWLRQADHAAIFILIAGHPHTTPPSNP